MKSYFPSDYLASRSRFQQEVSNLPGPKDLGSWKIPSAKDTDLQVDYAFLPAANEKPKNLFIIVSGVHGIESYTGSAIQSMYINELLPTLDRNQTSLLLVHALNPYGFKYHRRCTENLVNLNRNCSSTEKLYQLKNKISLDLATMFIPKEPLSSLQAPLFSKMKKKPSQKGDMIFFDETPLDEFIKGVGPGQYESPQALEFGGFKREPQIENCLQLLKSIMPKHKDIFLFDIHTGLGDRGRLHLLTGDPLLCINKELFNEILDPKSDESIYDFTSNEVEGFYETFGATNDMVAELTQSHQRVCALTLEFGTLGLSFENQIDSLNRWLLEHQASIYGCKDPNLEKEIEKLNLDKFFPQETDWQNQILETSRKFFSRIQERLKKQN